MPIENESFISDKSHVINANQMVKYATTLYQNNRKSLRQQGLLIDWVHQGASQGAMSETTRQM